MKDGANGTGAKGDADPENYELAGWNGNALNKFAANRSAAASVDLYLDQETNPKDSSVVATAATTDDEAEFDPYDVDTPENATSFWGTVMHMVIVGASPTLLNLPHTFLKVGTAVGFFGALFTVTLYVYCMHMVVASEYALCKRLRKPNLSYTEVVYHAFGKGPKRTRWLAAHARLLVYVDFMLIWAGGNAIYVIIICNNFQSTWEYFVGPVGTRPLMIYLSVPLVLLCWIPNLKLLVACSLLTNILNMSSIVVILWHVLHDLPALDARPAIGDAAAIPHFLGTIFITVNGTGLILSLKNQMKHPEKFKTKFGVMNLSYVTVGALYAVFGAVCYVKYGAATHENVIVNLPANAFGQTMIGVYGLGVVFFYPLVSYVTYDIVCNEMLKERLRKSRARKLHEYAIRTANALSSILLAYAAPDIELFMLVAGTVCTSLDSIIMPAVVEILVFAHERRFAFFAKNVAIIAFGVVLMVAGCSHAYHTIVKFYSLGDY